MQPAVRPAYAFVATCGIAASCELALFAVNVVRAGSPGVALVDAETFARVRAEVDGALAHSASLQRSEIIARPTFRGNACGALRYPANAVRLHHEGTAPLRVLIGAEGTAEAVGMGKSSGYAELDAAAVKSTKCLKFAPEVEDGRALDSWALVPIKFSMRDM